MNGAAPVFLVDTNVWLDNYLGFRPNHRASCEFLDEAVERGATLCHAATTAKDVHFFTCSTLKKAAREKGEACLLYTSTWTPSGRSGRIGIR